MADEKDDAFAQELMQLLNRHCRENASNTPDFILAEYLMGCLNAFDQATRRRAEWWKPAKPAFDGSSELIPFEGPRPSNEV